MTDCIQFRFHSVGFWYLVCEKQKQEKKIEKKNFFHQTETLLEDKISKKELTRKATNINFFFNI